MENASKAMIIIGAVIITVLIISAALYVYGTSQGLLVTTGESMSDQEILSFNQQWTYYDGEQTGSSVKDLLRRMMKNCTQNEKEQTRLLGLTIDKACKDVNHEMQITIKINQASDAGISNKTYFELVKDNNFSKILNPKDAKKSFSYVRNAIETRHVYKVKPSYSAQGVIDRIIINYN